MLLVSFLLVIVASIFLLSGLFFTKDLPLIFISIACSALAGLVLIVAVLRSRPRSASPGADDVRPIEPSAPEVQAPAPGRVPTGRVGTREFPIANYESLEVVEVLPLLGELEARDLEQVRQREASGRAHPWVLARIDALLESEAETGELEWASGRGPQGAEDEEADEWAAPEPGRSPAREKGSSDWAASDFELESSADYDDFGSREFPLPHYDDLRANEILPLLTTLGPDELEMIRREESAGKARTSILSRIDVLLGKSGAPPARRSPARPAPARSAARAPAARTSKAATNLPIENYDALTVAQITAQITGLTVAELRQVRTYEKRHKARAGVLQRIESAITRSR